GYKLIVGYIAVRYFFKQQTISCIPPVVYKCIIEHPDFFRVHHGHTSTIIAKDVVDISVFMRKHKVKTVSDIFRSYIPPDYRTGDKFKINAVAVTGSGSAADLQVGPCPTLIC